MTDVILPRSTLRYPAYRMFFQDTGRRGSDTGESPAAPRGGLAFLCPSGLYFFLGSLAMVAQRLRRVPTAVDPLLLVASLGVCRAS